MRDRLSQLIFNKLSETCRECSSFECTEELTDYLIANGVTVLPCKVGDTVYYINRFYHIELRKDTIYKAKVVRIVTNSLGISLVIQIRGEHGCTELSNIDCVETPNIEDFSKTVFLTKEEAEQALVNYGSSKIEKGGKG